ncbi:MAG TPA: sugar phosphate isomerase/epimerase family protein [Gemmataceae bacterium]|nr:sugar phosphate isomerase/epimerase family protein [Gemmataceae bacterium]
MNDAKSRFSLSVLLDGPPADFAAEVRFAADLGFGCVDVVALEDRPDADREALADAGLLVRCAAVGRGMPDGRMLDAADAGLRREAVEQMRRQLTDAARLGATCAYVVSGMEGSAAGLSCFAEACGLLADHAAGLMMRLCVEPIPGRALPDAAATLAWLRRTAHPNLGLLLDVGHCLIAGEDSATAARSAGPLLAHIHLNDNDGVGDLHWPLLTGRLTAAQLTDLAAALREIGFSGGLSLELKTAGAERAEAWRRSKEIAEGIFR